MEQRLETWKAMNLLQLMTSGVLVQVVDILDRYIEQALTDPKDN